MTVGNSRLDSSDTWTGYFESGKFVFIIDNLGIVVDTEKNIILKNDSGKVLYLSQIERFESELVNFSNDGISNIDLDFIYTPELSGTSQAFLSASNIYNIDVKGVMTDVSASEISMKELISFDRGAAANKKIELADNHVNFFQTNQSTTVAQDATTKTFTMPYAVPDGDCVVISISNEGKIFDGSDGQDVEVDLVLTGYLL